MLQSHLLVPAGMAALPRFIHWRLQPCRRGGKPAKIPCDARGDNVDPLRPSNWMTLDEAQFGRSVGYGVGFVFCEDDPYAFVDVDGCLDPATGELSEVGRAVLQWFPGAATEVSQSGTGLHLFFRYRPGSIPADHRNKCAAAGVELYTRWRYCALTGDRLRGDAELDFSWTLPAFVQKFGLEPAPPLASALAPGAPDPAYTGGEWSDRELVERMLRSRPSVGAAFAGTPHPQDLWFADAGVLGAAYPDPQGERPFDHSSADAALLGHLAYWCGRDPQRMERVFSLSQLGQRDKWTRRPGYRRRSVGWAVQTCARVYDRREPPPPGEDDAAPAALARPAFADAEAQDRLFAGWVYVRNSHQMLAPDGDLVKPESFRAALGGPKYLLKMPPERNREQKIAEELAGAPASMPRECKTFDPFEAFTRSQLRAWPQARDVCFRPAAAPNEIDDDGLVNTWRPPRVALVRGCVERFLRHAALLLPDERDRSILLTWLQSAARNWGRKFQWALVLQGAEGNGKTLFLRCMRAALSERYVHMPQANEIAEKFNDWFVGKLFVGVEEIRVSERREALEILKTMVTNDRIEVRAMHRDKRMADNFANFMFLTNYKDAVPTNRSDRRYCTFFSAQQSVDDIERDMPGDYFPQLYGWLIQSDGYAAVADWLRHADLTAAEFDPAGTCVRAPQTSSTAEAREISLGRIEQEILQAADDGRYGFRRKWLSSCALDDLLRDKRLSGISPRKRHEILGDLGYRFVGKCTRELSTSCDVGRPNLYRRDGMPSAEKGTSLDPQEYLFDQSSWT